MAARSELYDRRCQGYGAPSRERTTSVVKNGWSYVHDRQSGERKVFGSKVHDDGICNVVGLLDSRVGSSIDLWLRTAKSRVRFWAPIASL